MRTGWGSLSCISCVGASAGPRAKETLKKLLDVLLAPEAGREDSPEN